MKISVFVFLTFLISFTGFAQWNTPYSRFGIGEPDNIHSLRLMGMGELGAGMNENIYVSLINPASWNALSFTRVEAGATVFGTAQSTAEKSAWFTGGNFSGVTFGFPVSEKWGISLVTAMHPYSVLNYKTKIAQPEGTTIPAYTAQYEGTGGLTKFLIGTSFRLPFGLSFGGEVDYYFGELDYLSFVDFLDADTYSAEFHTLYSTRGVSGTFGVLSPDFASIIFPNANVKDLRLGASFSLGKDLETDTVFLKRTTLAEDTTYSGTTTMHLPYVFNIGLGVLVNNRYQLNADYRMQPWSEYSLAGKVDSRLQDSWRFSVGFEDRRREVRSGEPDPYAWRLGFSYEQLPYTINNTSLKQYSAYIGASMPVGRSNTIDFALQFATRGSTDNSLINEKIIKFGIGFSFSELWFLREDR